MNLTELSATEATVDEETSRATMAELFACGWRIYVKESTADLEDWLQRFFDAHAKVPGILSDSMIAFMPINVFRVHNPDRTSPVRMIEGVTYLNGAAAHIWFWDRTDSLLLFVAEEDARYWRYPDTYIRTLPLSHDP